MALNVGDTTHLIYALNNQTAVQSEDDFSYHSTRGTQSVKLFGPSLEQRIAKWESEKPSDTVTFDINVHNGGKPIPIDGQSTGPGTTYFCTVFELPAPTERHHMIRFDAVIRPEYIDIVHHILVYDCPIVEQKRELLNYAGHCYDNVPQELLDCNGLSTITAWAVGGEPYLFPKHVGFPFGAGDKIPRFVLMEVHYNNPKQRTDIFDTSGMRFYYTQQLRQYDGGILMVGHETEGVFTLPAGQPAVVSETYCPQQCVDYLINSTRTGTVVSPDGGIRLLSSLLHGHTTAAQIKFHRVDDAGVEHKLMDDNSYDFNFQTFTEYAEEVPLLPTDSLRVTCVYDTLKRHNTVHFGLTTQDEMCIVYSLYYPRSQGLTTVCTYANYSALQPSPGPDTVRCAGDLFQIHTTPLIAPNITVPYQKANCSHRQPPHPPAVVGSGPVVTGPANASLYDHTEVLSAEDDVTLRWTIDSAAEVAHFAMEFGAAQGWISLGFSPNGKMKDADIAMAYLDKTTVHISDRMADGHSLPTLDTYNDFFDIQARVCGASCWKADSPPDNNPPAAHGFWFWFGVVCSVVVAVSVVATLSAWYVWRRNRAVASAAFPDEERQDKVGLIAASAPVS